MANTTNEAKKKSDLALGFRLIDDQDALARTHWLIFDPPEGFELDDHPPQGPEDQRYVQIFSQKGQDFLTDSRVRGCRHRIIRHEEWPEESRTVIKCLWRMLEGNAEQKARHKRVKKRLQVILIALLMAPVVVLILLEALSLISLDQFNRAFEVFCYVGAGIIGAL